VADAIALRGDAVDPADALGLTLAAVLNGGVYDVRSLNDRWAALGWQPPEPAQREGGLWLIPPSTLDSVQHVLATTGGRAAPFLQLFERPPTTQPPQRRPLCGVDAAERPGPATGSGPRLDGALPRIRCSGGPTLPPPAAALFSARMCCVLEDAQLWPAAQRRWGSRAFLRAALRNVSCHVLNAPIEERKFSYWFDAQQMGIYMYICINIYLYLYLSIYVYIYIFLSFCFSIYTYIYRVSPEQARVCSSCDYRSASMRSVTSTIQ